jgi:hypothetical protein
MLDTNKCQKILEHHFATVTPEEFLANLEKFCPEFIAAGMDNSESVKIENAATSQNLNADIPVERINPSQKFNSPRVPGQDKGRVTMSADFNDPLPIDISSKFHDHAR